MPLISTKLHGAGDYLTGLGLLAAPKLLRVADARAAALLRGAGVAVLGLSAVTDYELGIRRKVPMRVHLLLDGAAGALLLASAGALRRSGAPANSWLPHVVIGLGDLAGAAVTAREPGDRVQPQGGAERPEMPGSQAAQTPAADALQADPPRAGDEPRAGALQADDASRSDEILVAREESAAAAAAGRIGGYAPPDAEDPAMAPVYQAGGGEQEGAEAAEAELIENATHGDGHGDPLHDAFSPEAEADRSDAVYGEADRIRSTEVVEDPESGEGGPAAGSA
jgi:hypothetical protein